MKKHIIPIFILSIAFTFLQSCGEKTTPTQVIESFYQSINNGKFIEISSKLDLIPDRQEIFVQVDKEAQAFYNNKATSEDKTMLNQLFKVSELKEVISENKKSAEVSFKLTVSGKAIYNMETFLRKTEEGWKMVPSGGIFNLFGYENVLRHMPSLDQSLSKNELNSYQVKKELIDYSTSVKKASKNKLFDQILSKYKNPRKGSYKEAIVIDAEEFGRFKEGLCSFRRGDFWGFMDTEGNIVIEPKLRFGEYRYHQYNGKSIKFPFFSYGFCLVYNEEGWPIYINKNGDTEIDGTYRFIEAAPFIGNYANIGIIKPRPANHYSLKQKRAYTTNYNTYINRNGLVRWDIGAREVLGSMIAYANTPTEGITAFKGKNNLYGFRKFEGEIIIPAQFTKFQNFSEGIAWVEKEDEYGRKKWGAIDKSGTIKVEFIYEKMPQNFQCGRAALVTPNQNRRVEFIDTNGETIYSFDFPHSFGSLNPYILGIAKGKDINGNTVMSPRTAYNFPIYRLASFAPEFKWENANVDPIFYTTTGDDGYFRSKNREFGDHFFYQNKRFYDYGRSDDKLRFHGFRGPDGNFKIIMFN